MNEKIIYDDIDGKSHDVTDMIHALGYVRVVRCKDCKHNPKTELGWVVCPMTGENTRQDDDYCSYGERKDDERK